MKKGTFGVHLRLGELCDLACPPRTINACGFFFFSVEKLLALFRVCFEFQALVTDLVIKVGVLEHKMLHAQLVCMK